MGLAQVLAETTNGQSTFYVPGLAQYGVTGWEYFGQDRLGSVRTLFDPTGELLLARNYDPFGNVLAQGGVGQSVFGYTGEQVDSTELVYLRARYYNPTIGRFLTPDPIIPDPLRSQSWNRYAYVENNPIRYVDPSGHQGCALLAGRPGVGMPVKCIPEGGGPRGGGLSGGMVGRAGAAITIGVGVGFGLKGVIEGGIEPVNPEEFNPTAPLPGNVCSEPVHLPGVQLGQGGLYEDPLTFPIPEPYPGLQIFEPAGPGIELSNVFAARQLTHDELKLIDRINSIPDFLADHPDLREEAKIVNRGGQLPSGRDHVTEARNQIRMLQNAVAHLQRVRGSRSPEAQQQIDEATTMAVLYLQELTNILSAR